MQGPEPTLGIDSMQVAALGFLGLLKFGKSLLSIDASGSAAIHTHVSAPKYLHSVSKE